MHLRCLSAMVLLGLLGCGTAETQSVRIDPALSSLIPQDTLMLAGVRMDAVRTTPVFQKWVAKQPLPMLDQFAEKTGVDPRKDLWEVLFTSNGKETVAMARGKFSPSGLEPDIKREGVTRIPYKGYSLLGQEEGAVVFMNSTTALAGSAPALRAIIDQRNRPGSPEAAALIERTKGISKENQIWLVSAGLLSKMNRNLPQSGNAANLARALSMMESLTAAADLRYGFSFFANGVCRNEQDAKSLSDALRGFIGLGRLSTPESQREMLQVYDALKIDQSERSIRLSGAVAEPLLERVIENWSKAFAQRRQPGAATPKGGAAK